MEQKTTRRIELMCIVALLFMMLPSADYLAKKAFADLSITQITPTGGSLSATSDCNDIASGNGIIWHGCNTILYAISESTNTVLANITIATLGLADISLATISGTSVIIVDTDLDVRKYTYLSNVITLSGIYDPAGCTIGTDMKYDELGFIWSVCTAEDRIIRFNPNTMTTHTFSQDLTDAIGLDCDAPIFVAYSAPDNIGAIGCGTSNLYETFTVTSTTSITLLDSEPEVGSEDGFDIHERYNKLIVATGTGINVYTYTDGGGILALVQSGLGSTTYTRCMIEPYISSDVFYLCILITGSNTQIDAFFSNSTGVFQVLNTVQAFNNPNGLGFDVQDQTWYIASSLNNQRYIKIIGLRDSIVEPDPIGGDPSEDGENNQVNGVCGNTDINGDGRVNVMDCVGSNSAWSGFTSGVPAVQVVGGITDGLGFTDCLEDGSDQETCGSGLFMFLIILLLVEFGILAGYLGFTGKLHADRQIVDVGLLMVIAGFAIVSLAFYLNWIPDIVFYSMVAIIAGFLTFGIISRLKGG